MLFQLFWQHRLDPQQLVFLTQGSAESEQELAILNDHFSDFIRSHFSTRPSEDHHPMICDEDSEYFQPQPHFVDLPSSSG
jgi:hypothetical protein